MAGTYITPAQFSIESVVLPSGTNAFYYEGVLICDPTTGLPVAPSAFGGGGGGGGSTYPTISDSLVVDTTGAYFYAVLTEPSGGGTPTVTFIALATGLAGTPTGAVKPVTPAQLSLAAGTNLIGKIELTDGTNVSGVAAGTTAAAVAQPAMVVALSPNSPLPVGTGTLGTVVLGPGTALAGKVELTDGTNVPGVAAGTTAAAVAQPALVVALSPNSPLPVGTGTLGTVILGPGTALAGKVGIDQTTPGTTNGVTITDGTNTGTVKAASTAAVAADKAVVVAVSPNNVLKAGDGTTSITIKAASTAAVAADPSVVVSVSPNNSVSTKPVADVAPATQNITVVDSGSSTATGANGESIITGSPTASSAASFALSGITSVRFQISGTWTGTLQAEMSQDGGTTWYQVGSHVTGTPYTAGAFTANVLASAPASGETNFRVRATAAMTGTAVIGVVESLNSNVVNLANPIAVFNSARTSTDKSGTVTSGGTAQVAIAANTLRKGWMLSNLSNDILYVRDDGTAATAGTGVPVYPGQSVDDGGQCGTAAISVLGATTSDAWSAKEYT